MITPVRLMAAGSGKQRDAQAYTAGDAPDGECAMVAVAGECIWPSDETIVRLSSWRETDVVLDLLHAGYAVELYGSRPYGRRR